MCLDRPQITIHNWLTDCYPLQDKQFGNWVPLHSGSIILMMAPINDLGVKRQNNSNPISVRFSFLTTQCKDEWEDLPFWLGIRTIGYLGYYPKSKLTLKYVITGVCLFDIMASTCSSY